MIWFKYIFDTYIWLKIIFLLFISKCFFVCLSYVAIYQGHVKMSPANRSLGKRKLKKSGWVETHTLPAVPRVPRVLRVPRVPRVPSGRQELSWGELCCRTLTWEAQCVGGASVSWAFESGQRAEGVLASWIPLLKFSGEFCFMKFPATVNLTG